MDSFGCNTWFTSKQNKILSNHRLFHFIGSVVYRNCQNVSARSKPLKNCRSRIVWGLFTDCLFLKFLCVSISFFDPSPILRFSLRVPFQVKLDYTFVIKHWHTDRVRGYSLSRFLVNNHFFNSIFISKEQKVLKWGRKMEANKKIMECRWKHKMCWTPQ